MSTALYKNKELQMTKAVVLPAELKNVMVLMLKTLWDAYNDCVTVESIRLETAPLRIPFIPSPFHCLLSY